MNKRLTEGTYGSDVNNYFIQESNVLNMKVELRTLFVSAIDKWSSKPRLLSSLVKAKVHSTFNLFLLILRIDTGRRWSETSWYRAL